MTDTARPAETTAPKILAWDLPTRIFKWTLVALVVSAWVSNKWGGAVPAWHVWNGEAILVAVVFRVLWGIFGGSTARFGGFIAAPGRTVAYAMALLRGREPHFLGHNPLGGWMVVVLLALLGAQAMTGLYSADADRLIIEGPLAKTVGDAAVTFASHWHHLLFDLLKIAVVLHLAAIAFHAVKGERLVPAMITGRKPARAYADTAPATPGSIGLALGCLAGAVLIVTVALKLLGGW